MLLLVRPTANNIFLTLVNRGRVIRWTSAGCIGLRGPRRSTPLAAEQVARNLAGRLGRRRLEVRVLGPRSSRIRAVLRGLFRYPLSCAIRFCPPLAHNGVRPCKGRRL